MTNYICKTCGVQYGETASPPEHCLICEDERQYIGMGGQQWTTLDEMLADGLANIVWEGLDLTYIKTNPAFAISQCARILHTQTGNILWESISFIDDATVEEVERLGGISAIAISHPHFYSSMVEWSKAFGGAPIYLHADDREWVMRPDPCIVHWEGETHELLDGLTLIRCGGHFDGSTVLHWSDCANGQGALLTGDTIQVVPDHRYVSFMRSYPNLIPLPASKVRHIVGAVEPFAFGQIYSSWPDRVVTHDGKAALHRSAERYIQAISEA